jgi:hypothetical protein
MQVAGYIFPVQLDINEDALFMPLTSSWGWATWKRAWEHFDAEAKGYDLLVSNSKLRRALDINGKYPYFKMLESQKSNKVDSWAIRWYLSVFIKNGIVLYPKKSLVENFGFDGSGVNCVASSFPQMLMDRTFKVCEMPSIIALGGSYHEVIKMMPTPKFSVKTYLNRFWKIFKVKNA